MRPKAFPSAVSFARPATGHMPFAGHRTVATIWAYQDAAIKRALDRHAEEYGFDPKAVAG